MELTVFYLFIYLIVAQVTCLSEPFVKSAEHLKVKKKKTSAVKGHALKKSYLTCSTKHELGFIYGWSNLNGNQEPFIENQFPTFWPEGCQIFAIS